MARPKGVGGRPGAGHGPPTSRCTGVRRPCRPPQRSLPSCPSEVPAPPGTRGKLRPDAGRLLDSRWGAGPGQPGRGCAAGSEEARRQIRSQSSCNPEPRLQAARRGRGVGRRASAAGGGRRREAGAGGGREAGRVRTCHQPASPGTANSAGLAPSYSHAAVKTTHTFLLHPSSTSVTWPWMPARTAVPRRAAAK